MPGYRTLLCTTVSIFWQQPVLANRRILHGARRRGPSVLLTTVPIPGTKANTTGGNMYVFRHQLRRSDDADLLSCRSLQRRRRCRRWPEPTRPDSPRSVPSLPSRASPATTAPPGRTASSRPFSVALLWTDANSRVVSINLRNGNTVGDVFHRPGAPGLRADETGPMMPTTDCCL